MPQFLCLQPRAHFLITWLWRPGNWLYWSHGTVIIRVTQKGIHIPIDTLMLWLLPGDPSMSPGSGGQWGFQLCDCGLRGRLLIKLESWGTQQSFSAISEDSSISMFILCHGLERRCLMEGSISFVWCLGLYVWCPSFFSCCPTDSLWLPGFGDWRGFPSRVTLDCGSLTENFWLAITTRALHRQQTEV